MRHDIGQDWGQGDQGAYFSQALGDSSTKRSMTISPREVSSKALIWGESRVVCFLLQIDVAEREKSERKIDTELGPIRSC